MVKTEKTLARVECCNIIDRKADTSGSKTLSCLPSIVLFVFVAVLIDTLLDHASTDNAAVTAS